MVEIYDITADMKFSTELSWMIAELPEWRRRKVLSYRFDIDRFLCAKSFMMLKGLLQSEFGIDECPEFSYGPSGKPYFTEYPDIHFNLSHCRKGIACAVHNHPVGIDIEGIQYDDMVAQRILSPDEYAEIQASGDPAVKFTELWTKKESFLKLTGQGLVDDMRDVLAHIDGTFLRTSVDKGKGYACSVAYRI